MVVNNDFGGETGHSDLTLIVQDHKIPVSKCVLCIASPVFRAMLETDFQEKSKSEIQLPKKKYEDFIEFLNCIYPDKMKKVSEKNVYQLLPLANEYQVKKMEQRCQKILLQIIKQKHAKNVMELYRHLYLSETYVLEELKKECIYLASEHKLQQFKDARGKYQISEESHSMIIELALKKRELDADDVKTLALSTKPKKTISYYDDLTEFTLTGNINSNARFVKDNLRAARSLHRYQIDDTKLKSRVIKNLHNVSPKEHSKHSEEFDLLPEEIKLALHEPKKY